MKEYSVIITDLLQFLYQLGIRSTAHMKFEHTDHNRWYARHIIVLNKRFPLK